MNNNTRWGQLGLKEKNVLLGIYASKRYTDLASIINHYNTFQAGGKLTFNEWKSQMQSEYPDIEMDNTKAGYDYVRYFNDNYDDAIRQLSNLQHFPDTYKLPNHPTFSNESIYSRGPMMGGNWVNDSTFSPSIINRQQYPNIYKKDRPYTEREIYGNKYQQGGSLGKVTPFGNLYQEGGPIFKKSQEQYYDRDNDIIYANDSIGEGYQHEYFHARPNTTLLNSLKPYYENLNDERLVQLGADLPFVKRLDNDPNHFYSPEELGARVTAAKYMLNKAGVNNINIDFLRNARQNELQYGDNFRDLLHMYNDENLSNILNIKYSKGGPLGHITPYGQWQYPNEVTTIPSNNITMKGVDYPVIGVSDTGDTKYMLPNMDYLFDGNYVTEYPLHKFQRGGNTDGISSGRWRQVDDETVAPEYALPPVTVEAEHPLWSLPWYKDKKNNPNINRYKDQLYNNWRRHNEAGKEYLKRVAGGLSVMALPIGGAAGFILGVPDLATDFAEMTDKPSVSNATELTLDAPTRYGTELDNALISVLKSNKYTKPLAKILQYNDALQYIGAANDAASAVTGKSIIEHVSK